MLIWQFMKIIRQSKVSEHLLHGLAQASQANKYQKSNFIINKFGIFGFKIKLNFSDILLKVQCYATLQLCITVLGHYKASFTWVWVQTNAYLACAHTISSLSLYPLSETSHFSSCLLKLHSFKTNFLLIGQFMEACSVPQNIYF